MARTSVIDWDHVSTDGEGFGDGGDGEEHHLADTCENQLHTEREEPKSRVKHEAVWKSTGSGE